MRSWDKQCDNAMREVCAWRWEMGEVWFETNGDYHGRAYQFALGKYDEALARYNKLARYGYLNG